MAVACSVGVVAAAFYWRKADRLAHEQRVAAVALRERERDLEKAEAFARALQKALGAAETRGAEALATAASRPAVGKAPADGRFDAFVRGVNEALEAGEERLDLGRHPAIRPILLGALAHEKRARSAAALLLVGHGRDLAGYLHEVETVERSETARTAISEALVRALGREDGPRIVEGLVKDPSPWVRAMIAGAAGRAYSGGGDPALLGAVARLAEDAVPEVSQPALAALIGAGAPGSGREPGTILTATRGLREDVRARVFRSLALAGTDGVRVLARAFRSLPEPDRFLEKTVIAHALLLADTTDPAIAVDLVDAAVRGPARDFAAWEAVWRRFAPRPSDRPRILVPLEGAASEEALADLWSAREFLAACAAGEDEPGAAPNPATAAILRSLEGSAPAAAAAIEAAAIEAAKTAGAAWTPRLVGLLPRLGEESRLATAAALARFGHPDVTGTLAAYIRTQPRFRARAIEALAGSGRALNALAAEAVFDTDDARSAARLLEVFAERRLPLSRARMEAILVQPTLSPRQMSSYYGYLESSGGGEALSLVAELVRSKRVVDRAGAVGFLARSRDPALMPIFRDALADADPRVREAALEAFAGRDVKDLVERLSPLARDADPLVRLRLARVLADTVDPFVSGTLVVLSRDVDMFVREAAVFGLEKQTGPTVVPALKDRLDDPEIEVRNAALQMVVRRGDYQRIDELFDATADFLVGGRTRRFLARQFRVDRASAAEWKGWWSLEGAAQAAKR